MTEFGNGFGSQGVADQLRTNMNQRSAGNAAQPSSKAAVDFGELLTGPASPAATTTVPSIVPLLPGAVISLAIDRSAIGAAQWMSEAVTWAPDGAAPVVRNLLDAGIPLMFVDPDNAFSESSSPGYGSQQPPGRHEPMQTYAGNGFKQISLRTVYRAQDDAGLRHLRLYAGLFDALRYPMRTVAGRWLPPPPLVVNIPEVLRMPARLVSVEIAWGGGLRQSAFGWGSAVYEQVDISLSLQSSGAAVGESIVDARTVRPDRGYGYQQGQDAANRASTTTALTTGAQA